jgi:DNA gyrase subunit A
MPDDAEHGKRPASKHIAAIVQRTESQLAKARERAAILRAILLAIGQFDAVTALAQSCDSSTAVPAVMGLLDVDETQANAVLDMQLRTLIRRRRVAEEYEKCEAMIADYQAILTSPDRQRQLAEAELAADA